MGPPKHNPEPVLHLHKIGGRTFTAGGKWIARLNTMQTIAEDEHEAARLLLEKINNFTTRRFA